MFGLTFLTPAMLKIAGIITALLVFGFLYQHRMQLAEDRGYTRAQTEYTKKALVASEAARKRELILQNQMQEAQNESLRRETVIAAAVDRARNELDGLRDELSTLSDRLSRASSESLRKYAITANAVLRECTDRYSRLAQKADQHANDTLMFQQAWPKP